MASANQNTTVKPATNEWMLANPWLWLAAGLGFTLWAWLWAFAFGENASDYRVIVLALGVLAGGVGVWLRWNNRQTLYLHYWRGPFGLLLGCTFALLGLGVTILFVMSFFVDNESSLKSAPLFLVWLSVGPTSFVSARYCLNRKPDESTEREAEQEAGLAFSAGAGICLLGSFALYIPADPADWDTMRMFLRVLAAVSFYAAVLTLATPGMRRLMLSLLFTLHFIGINTAALSAPPSPWIIQQTWMRFFRPYLQFVYLNNAYHFYAPEPGPSCYIWFRVIYQAPDGQSEEGLWFKIPQLDEKGRIQHPVALDYQRFLSLTEAVAHPGPTRPEWVFDARKQEWVTNPFYAERYKLAMPEHVARGIVGQVPPKQIRVPMHPAIPTMEQVRIPNEECRRLIASYCRFVARKFASHPDREKSDWTFKSVKVYRVIHWIPPIQWYVNELPPTDPELYRPYYYGNYNADGTQREEPDPYLYWLLPSIRDQQNDPDSQIRDYARLHAGDRQWIRRGSDKAWVETHEADR